MKLLKKVMSMPLYWVQPRALERWFELRVVDEIVATLSWRSACGTLARGEIGDESWTFKRVGFLNPRVTVRQAGSEVDLAVFWPRWLGDGTLELAYGQVFRWQATNFWASDWVFTASDGTPLVAFKEGSQKGKLSDLFKLQSRLEIRPSARDLAELPLLILLGWYLMVLRQEDTAAAAGAVAAAS